MASLIINLNEGVMKEHAQRNVITYRVHPCILQSNPLNSQLYDLMKQF